ncbi:mediator of rna polymerase ii transcription subunit 5 [Diplodia corticola]|uniref:Mediator of RNA polymerase II transcription subunit 5 n=1 Tax=Diplodia corticola TaxID=236234 RepID=A0A1J9R6I2_9PEZI|nr:mediator of rna polymerase ii transcription subunit 5 [Diplodia corticola]OJD36145.1 mediator of rna polymerase ii transcription subunit 5 [Diplodia corticola]
MATWTQFVDRCLQNRLSADKVERLAVQLSKRIPRDEAQLAEALLQPRSRATACSDPLIPVYLERLLVLGFLNPPEILHALFRYSRDYAAGAEHSSRRARLQQWHITPDLEELVFARLSKAFITVERPSTFAEVQKTLAILTQWMNAVNSSQTAESVMHSLADGTQEQRTQTVLSLSMLVIAMLENPKVAGAAQAALPKGMRKSLSDALTGFVPHLTQASLQWGDRLSMLQKQYSLTTENASGGINDGPGNHGLDVSVLQLETVMDLPIINSRAGLYVFINSLLTARPLTDDNMILNYLHARYKVDYQSMAVGLITASFDVLAANTTYRSESNEAIFNFRSFLINKVPSLVAILAGSMFPTTTPELCITQALNHIDRNAFPSFSQTFDMAPVNSLLSDVRQDFLVACALHQLVPESSIERLLGETPMSSVPVGGKYVKENLVAQCSTNFERVEELLNEIEGMDGNAGAIVGAMTDIIRNLCATRETMSLKTICNTLSRKPRSLDVMLQYTSPASILQPLCQLLDSWKNDEDQSEYQPVYDEFGSVLLLVQAFMHRHDLKSSDLGLEDASFVIQLTERGHKSLDADELTEDQNKYLAGWLRGLYDPEGISDELLSNCKPQDFYLLVPTIFSQTIFACSADVLPLDTVKAGLEFLLETFLLPSLVGAVMWITSHALEQNVHDLDITMQILTRLIRPTSISGEAQAMHSTIVSMVSRRLERCLKSIQHREPSRTDVNPLLESLRPYHDYERTPWSSSAELEPWMSNPGASFRSAIKFTMQHLTSWNSTADLTPTPPAYTHRQIFSALQIVGAQKVLRAILEELKNQTVAGAGAVAIDIAVNIVCAPLHVNSCTPVSWLNSQVPAHNPQRNGSFSLREMLKNELDDPASLIQADAGLAEAAIRLHRRVEAQLAEAAAAGVHLPTSAGAAADAAALDGNLMQGIEIGDVSVDISAAGAAAVASTAGGATGANTSTATMDQNGLDITADLGAADGTAPSLDDLGLGGDGGMDGVLDAAGTGTADDDVFSGLMGFDDDLNF